MFLLDLQQELGVGFKCPKYAKIWREFSVLRLMTDYSPTV